MGEPPFEIDTRFVYVATPSDLQEHRDFLEQMGKDRNTLVCVHPDDIKKIPNLPEHICFRASEGIDNVLAPFAEKGSIRLCITNAMSNALGDHLIGLRAYGYLYGELLQRIPEDKIHVDFYQIHPTH